MTAVIFSIWFVWTGVFFWWVICGLVREQTELSKAEEPNGLGAFLPFPTQSHLPPGSAKRLKWWQSNTNSKDTGFPR